ncbi:MAG TPA: signal peptidase I [Acidobacteriaceae bacterium]|nr:signal peptidase I [Acidobacteriaceae bacterium]
MAKHTQSSQAEPKQTRETWLQSLASICTTLAVGLFVLTFIAQNFMIPSASMASTILVGDHVIGDNTSLAPPTRWAPLPYRPLKRGEPVVFHKPVQEPDGQYLVLVKRVIGLPGDRIHLEHGVVYINGIAQNEPYAANIAAANYDPYRDDFPAVAAGRDPNVTATWALEMPEHISNGDLIVPPDCYFMMGDNRANSLDSRYRGFVHRENLIGRPLFIYWSFVTPDSQVNKTSFGNQTEFALHTRAAFLRQDPLAANAQGDPVAVHSTGDTDRFTW